MEVVHFISKSGKQAVIHPSGYMSLEEAANMAIPVGIAYAFGEESEIPSEYPFISVGERQWKINQLNAEISAIEAEPLPPLPDYPDQPVNDEEEQLAAIQAVKDATPELLPADMPPQTQEDFTNATKNADAIIAYEQAVARAESSFISYESKLNAWQAECDRIDQQFSAVLAAYDESKIQRIAHIQSQIDALQAG